MKLNNVLFGLSLSAVALGVIAAEPAPVIDVTNPSTSMTLEERITELERQQEARNRKQISDQRLLDDLQNELDEIRGVTELHTHQLGQILNRQRELYQELDRRVEQALKPATSVETATALPSSNPNNQQSYSSDLTENQAYDQAVNLVLKDKRYEQAIPAFKAFNEKFPNSSYAANAHYWLGQLLFNKGSIAEAKIEFTTVMTQFTDSSKRSDSILKLAMVESKQKNKNKAKALYLQLIKEYPDSSAAKLAQPRLDNL